MATDLVSFLLIVLDNAEIVLGPGEHCIGRSVDCEVRIDDPLASRRHATLVVRPSGVSVRDLGSRNGVLVDGVDVEDERALVEGSIVTVGSKVLSVVRIGRAGEPVPVARDLSTPNRRALAKIEVIRRAVPVAQARLESDGTTTLQGRAPGGPSAAAFHLIAEATARCIATGREERVEAILDAPLVEMAATLRAGIAVEYEVLSVVVEQALLLCEITHARRWIDYVHDHFDLVRRPIPLAVVDRLMSVVDAER
jgi:pSer/pThr/pTyr-binding forkhead associated (FHA) protein